MPSPHDIEPFDRLMDAEHMRGVLERHASALLGQRARIIDCTIGYSHCKTFAKPASAPKSTLAACYRLTVRGIDESSAEEHLIYLKAYRDGRSGAEHEQLVRDSIASVGIRQAGIHLADLDAIAWAFPSDPALPHLPEIIDPARVLAHLPYEAFGAACRAPEDIRSVAHTIVNYRPELRCSTRIDLQLARPDLPPLALFAKTFKDDSGRTIFARQQALWTAACDSHSALSVARPLAYDPTLKTMWLSAVDGTPMVRALDAARDHPQLVDGIASGLAALHHCGLATDTVASVDAHLAEIDKKVDKLARRFPQHRDAIIDLACGLAASVARLPEPPRALIHGDFHVGQLLASGGNAVFFDFDEIAMGNPAQDLANFIIDLACSGMPEVAEHVTQALPEAYARHAGNNLHPGWLCWHALIQLVNKLHRSVLRHQPDLDREAATLLGEIARARVRLTEALAPPHRRAA